MAVSPCYELNVLLLSLHFPDFYKIPPLAFLIHPLPLYDGEILCQLFSLGCFPGQSDAVIYLLEHSLYLLPGV